MASSNLSSVFLLYDFILFYLKVQHLHLFKLPGTAPWSHLPLTDINVVSLAFIATATISADIRGVSLQ
jgi:hypothetical protein